MRRRAGVIGTGAMGAGVAARLVERGHEVHTRDIRPEADAVAGAAIDLAAAREVGAVTPFGELTAQVFADTLAMGLG